MARSLVKYFEGIRQNRKTKDWRMNKKPKLTMRESSQGMELNGAWKKLRITSGNSSFQAREGPPGTCKARFLAKETTPRKTRRFYACVCEAHESTRKRIQETQERNSMSHKKILCTKPFLSTRQRRPRMRMPQLTKSGKSLRMCQHGKNQRSKASTRFLSRHKKKAQLFTLQRSWTYAT